MRNIRVKQQGSIGEISVEQRVDYAISGFHECSIIPVIHKDGKARPTLVRDDICGSDYWGCAICKQWHPLDTARCPLADGGRIEYVLFGPYEATGEGEFYVSAQQRAEEPRPAHD